MKKLLADMKHTPLEESVLYNWKYTQLGALEVLRKSALSEINHFVSGANPPHPLYTRLDPESAPPFFFFQILNADRTSNADDQEQSQRNNTLNFLSHLSFWTGTLAVRSPRSHLSIRRKENSYSKA